MGETCHGNSTEIQAVLFFKNVLKYVKLLDDNVHLHKVNNVTIFLEDDKVTVLFHPAHYPDMVTCDYFLIP